MATETFAAEQSVETETRVRVDGQAAWIGPGDIELRQGVGVNIKQDEPGEAFTMNAPTPKPGDLLPLFHAGEAAAGEIGRMKQIDPGALQLIQIEANCQTPPPAGTDGANHWVLRAAGTDSGSADLPLDHTGAFHNLRDATLSEAGTFDDRNQLPSGMTVFVTRFDLNAQTTIAGVGFFAREESAASWGGTRRQAFIQDADRNTLAQTGIEDFTPTINVREFVEHSLLSAVTLSAQTDYYLVWVLYDDPTGCEYYAQGAGSVRSSNDTTGVVDHDRTEGWTSTDASHDETTPLADLTLDHRPLFALYGAVVSTELGGDAVVSWVAVGAPPAGGPSDVNIRCVFDTAEVEV